MLEIDPLIQIKMEKKMRKFNYIYSFDIYELSNADDC